MPARTTLANWNLPSGALSTAEVRLGARSDARAHASKRSELRSEHAAPRSSPHTQAGHPAPQATLRHGGPLRPEQAADRLGGRAPSRRVEAEAKRTRLTMAVAKRKEGGARQVSRGSRRGGGTKTSFPARRPASGGAPDVSGFRRPPLPFRVGGRAELVAPPPRKPRERGSNLAPLPAGHFRSTLLFSGSVGLCLLAPMAVAQSICKTSAEPLTSLKGTLPFSFALGLSSRPAKFEQPSALQESRFCNYFV